MNLPHDPKALLARANSLRSAGRLVEALPVYQSLVALAPGEADYLNELGNCLQALGRYEDAIAAQRRATELQPNKAYLLNNLGVSLARSGSTDEAATVFRRSLSIVPDQFPILANLGNALHQSDRYEEAVQAFERAIRLRNDQAAVFRALGNSLASLKRYEEASSAYARAVELDPRNPSYRASVAVLLLSQGRVSESIKVFRDAMRFGSLQPWAHSNFLLGLHYVTQSGAAEIFEEHRRWAQTHAPLVPVSAHANEPVPDRRLRIGYVSPDFRSQSVGFFIEPLLRMHDSSQFEITCYSDNDQTDDMTHRLRSYVERWHNIWGYDDRGVTELVRADGIDILVDLSGHTGSNRLLVFAQKPAPIQVTYLGYADTTGLRTIDYRITDNYADPLGTSEQYHTEKLVRPFASAWCYQPPADAPGINPLPASQKDVVTFGSFSIPAKISSDVVALWSRVLRSLPGAILLLKYDHYANAGIVRYIREMFAAAGIEGDRLEFAGRSPTQRAHLATYNRIDLSLDTFPYHGTTTTCEALWMGVPVVTLAGNTHVSRVGVSLLTNAGLCEFIAHGPDEFVRIATELATGRTALAELRGSLRERMRRSPLMDPKGFTQSFEAAYRQMWRHWCASRASGKSE